MAAALLYAGPGAALSHVTAASWLGMLSAPPRRIHITAPGKRRSLNEVRVHGRGTVERVWHKRFPVIRPAQTLLDIAAVLRFTELRRALAEAEYLRLVSLDEADAVLGRGKPGSAATARPPRWKRIAGGTSSCEPPVIRSCATRGGS